MNQMRKLHWTQRPENKEKIFQAAKLVAKNRKQNRKKSRAEKAVIKHKIEKVKIVKIDYLTYLIDKLIERS